MRIDHSASQTCESLIVSVVALSPMHFWDCHKSAIHLKRIVECLRTNSTKQKVRCLPSLRSKLFLFFLLIHHLLCGILNNMWFIFTIYTRSAFGYPRFKSISMPCALNSSCSLNLRIAHDNKCLSSIMATIVLFNFLFYI